MQNTLLIVLLLVPSFWAGVVAYYLDPHSFVVQSRKKVPKFPSLQQLGKANGGISLCVTIFGEFLLTERDLASQDFLTNAFVFICISLVAIVLYIVGLLVGLLTHGLSSLVAWCQARFTKELPRS